MTIQYVVEKFERYVTELMQEKRHRPKDILAQSLLFVLSRTFRSLVQLRISIYNQRIFRYRTLGCLVVSIGNLSVGGTGKTPVVEVFARTLQANGRTVAILSRGYRNKAKPFFRAIIDFLFRRHDEIPPRIVSDGKNLLLDSQMAGDEPYMLASNLKDVIVLVDKNRVKSGRYAINHFNADTLILDDGFQYLSLKPRLNILLIDASRPFDNHHLLPRGLLREPIKNIQRADYVFLTKSDGSNRLRHLKQFVKRHNHRAEIIECTHRPLYLEDLYSKQQFDLDLLRGKKIAAISGIAAPEGFEKFLEQFGGTLVYTERYADHHRYSQQEIIDFINRALWREAAMIITTEKDAVRFPLLDRRDLQILFMRVEIDILSGHESFRDCIARICFAQPPRT